MTNGKETNAIDTISFMNRLVESSSKMLMNHRTSQENEYFFQYIPIRTGMAIYAFSIRNLMKVIK